MAKRALTRAEIEAHRDEHLQFMQSSSAAFDAGALGEAKRLAVSLRVLLHQTAQSKAILSQLGERTGSWPAFSFEYDPENLLVHQGLTAVVTTVRNGVGSGTYRAMLGENPAGPRQLRFGDWWEQDIVLSDTKGITYTRRKLVLYAANKDGGAHVDPDLDLSFESLKDGSGSGWSMKSDTGDTPITDVLAHSIRQVAFEVLRHYGKQ